MLSLSAVLGTVASLALALAANEHLPVYLLHTDSSRSAGKLFEAELAPMLFSHFLGDGVEELSGDNEAILRQFPSRFLDESRASIVVMENFYLDDAEKKFGSPNFYLENGSADELSRRAATVSVDNLKSRLSSGEGVFRVNAVETSQPSPLSTVVDDFTQSILGVVEKSDAKIMLIGIPPQKGGNGQSKSRQAKRAAAAAAGNTSGVPGFFDTEDACISQTNSCSSRGSCVKTSSGKFACRCVPTTENEYTYYWGGNDCSKRDVSFQFFLIVGTTLAVIVAASLSVTMLFNLGKENGVPDTVKL